MDGQIKPEMYRQVAKALKHASEFNDIGKSDDKSDDISPASRLTCLSSQLCSKRTKAAGQATLCVTSLPSISVSMLFEALLLTSSHFLSPKCLIESKKVLSLV